MDKFSPYSVYVNKRPLRVAYLVPSTIAADDLTELISYSQGKWGGRYSPIIQTDGRSLSTEIDWKYLQFVDPDVIKSFVPLEQSLVEQIDRQLSPYSIEVPSRIDEDRFFPRNSDEGIPLLPNSGNVQAIDRWFSTPSLVVFKCGDDINPILKHFISRNFGLLDPQTWHVDQALKQVKTKEFTISDTSTVVEAITELCTFKSYMYPIQVCSRMDSSREHPKHKRDEEFTTVIGDTVADVLYAWNGIHLEPLWSRGYLRRLWLPKALLNDGELTNALGRWIEKLSDPGGSHKGQVNFVSMSETREDLTQIVESLRPSIRRVRIDLNQAVELGVEEDRERVLLNNISSADLYRGNSSKEHFVLFEPSISQGLFGHWMADVYIQYSQSSYSARGSWLRLPLKNRLALSMFHKPSRITVSGIPSVLMKMGERELQLQLLSEREIFHYLLADRNTPCYGLDPRGKLERNEFYRVARSDKGRYLSGLMELFGSVADAYQDFEANYWRKLFDILSKNSFSYAERLQVIRSKLRKIVQKNTPSFLASDMGIEWVANQIIQFSKDHAGSGKEIPYEQFLDEAVSEVMEYRKAHKSGSDPAEEQTKEKVRGEIEQELRRSITRLIEANILQIGIRPGCPQCGVKDWYNVTETNQSIKCKGCGFMFPIRAEEKWFYRLNTLVQAANALHGLTPVILVLGQLMRWSSCAIVSPCLDLYEKKEDEKPYSDLDILCIIDGQLIIGEVKQTNGLFDENSFKTMAEIARRVRPYKVIFSSMEPKANGFIKEKVEQISADLKPLGVSVEWYPLDDHLFEPRPYFL